MQLVEGQALFGKRVIIPVDEIIPKFSEIEEKFQIPHKEMLDYTYTDCFDNFRDFIKSDSIREERTFLTEYLDTEANFFKDKGASFRIRDNFEQGMVEIGIKGLSKVQKDLVIRLEDEININALDLSTNLPLNGKFKSDVANRMMEEFDKHYAFSELKCFFLTEVTRRSFEVVLDKITLDIVFDELKYKAPGPLEDLINPIHEIEIEYKKGALKLSEIRHSFNIIKDYIESANRNEKNFKIITSSKAERGYEVLRHWDNYNKYPAQERPF